MRRILERSAGDATLEGRARTRRAYGAVAATLLLLAVVLPRAASAQQVAVRILITNASWAGCGDGPFGGPPEIYWRVTIDGNELNNRSSAINSNFSPFSVERQFSQTVDFSAGTVDIRIAQWDRDGGLTFDDDRCDISSDGDELDFTLDLAACTVSGEVNGSCGTTLAGEASFRFEINVVEPASAPGLQSRCTHSPMWPQPGDTVTITASSLDDTLGSRLADSIEIWFEDRSAPVISAGGFSQTFTSGALTTSSFNYGCRILDDGLSIWTGWRTVAIGSSALTDAYGGRIPILYSAPRSSALDFVFYADQQTYTGADDPQFISDVENAINNSYFTDVIYLQNQDKINFWLAQETGDAGNGFPGCDLSAPQKAWEDAAAIFHTDNFRDCAKDGKFTSEPTSFGTILHETGHRPFGLADEYCCDGGYFQNEPFPNLYDLFAPVPNVSVLTCSEDAPDLGKTPADCRSFVEDVPWWFDDTWYTTDPASNDIMVDQGPRQPHDNRRMNWLFDVCRGAGC